MSRYITAEEYTALTGNAVTDHTEHMIQRASEQIDTLTFNRIRAIGFEKLYPLQQEIIKTVCAEQTAFISEFGDMLDSPLSSYGIGNVSMSWDASKVIQISGVIMQADVYSRLLQTGLCDRSLR